VETPLSTTSTTSTCYTLSVSPSFAGTSSDLSSYAHIADPNERRRLALAEIDKAPFGWYHVRACVVAGVGFFTDAYDIFAINLVTAQLGIVFWQDAKKKPGTIPSPSDTVSLSSRFHSCSCPFGSRQESPLSTPPLGRLDIRG
jgi:hypothetical protein